MIHCRDSRICFPSQKAWFLFSQTVKSQPYHNKRWRLVFTSSGWSWVSFTGSFQSYSVWGHSLCCKGLDLLSFLYLGLYEAQVNQGDLHSQSGLSGGCCWNPCIAGSVVQLHLSAWFLEIAPVHVQLRGQGSRGADTVVSSQVVFSIPKCPEIHFQSFWLLWIFLWYLQLPPPPHNPAPRL